MDSSTFETQIPGKHSFTHSAVTQRHHSSSSWVRTHQTHVRKGREGPRSCAVSCDSVCRQGWNESPHLQLSQYGHLRLRGLFRLLLQLRVSNTFFWGMVHFTNVWNRWRESHVRSTYLCQLRFWVCFLGEWVGGRSRLLPTLLHICKRLVLMEPMRTLLQAEDRAQPMTTLPTAVDC